MTKRIKFTRGMVGYLEERFGKKKQLYTVGDIIKELRECIEDYNK